MILGKAALELLALCVGQRNSLGDRSYAVPDVLNQFNSFRNIELHNLCDRRFVHNFSFGRRKQIVVVG